MKTTYAQAVTLWDEAKKLNPKEKYKQLKSICWDFQLNENPTIEEIEFFERLIRICLKTIGFPGGLTKKLNMLLIKRCETQGVNLKTVKILMKKNFEVITETATIGIGDKVYENNDWFCNENKAIESGKRIFFSTAGDGVFDVQVRVVDSPEPILKLNEYKKIGETAGPYIIQVPSGELTVNDYTGMGKVLLIQPGKYKLSIYCFLPNEDSLTYYICLARTNQDAQNKIHGDVIPVLQC